MVPDSLSSLQQNIARLVFQHTGIKTSRLLTKTFDQLNLDLIDLLEIILLVEKKYQLIIPDEVPLNSIADFAYFIQAKSVSDHLQPACSAIQL